MKIIPDFDLEQIAGGVLLGDRGNDRIDIRTNGGDDRLLGNRGNDVLLGADGNDLLIGGAGRDF